MQKFTSIIIFYLLISVQLIAQKKYTLLVGTYTSGKSQGIYTYQFSRSDATTTLLSITPSSNPSYLAIAPNKKYVFAVNENADSVNNGGSVTAFAIKKRGKQLTLLNMQPTMGNHPCYVTTDITGNYLFVGNYNGGNLSVLSITKNGLLLPAVQTIAHTGKSKNIQRQEKAHVHATVISADNKYLLVPDLGIDKIMLYKFDAIKGMLSPTNDAFVSVQAGAGPRHIVFSPTQQFVYLTEELTGTIAAFKYLDGTLKLVQTISTVPENFKGNLSVADIHLSKDGKFLYASNRADAESIAMYAVNTENGILTNIGYQPCLGLKPRNFTISPDDNYLLVANQESDNIIIFKRDTTTGLLTDTKKSIAVPNPVCLKWLEE